MALLWVGERGIDTEFIPNSDTGSIRMTLTFPAGTPIEDTAAVDRLEAAIVRSTGSSEALDDRRQTGRLRVDHGGNVARMNTEMDKNRRNETNRAMRDIRKLSSIAPGRAC